MSDRDYDDSIRLAATAARVRAAAWRGPIRGPIRVSPQALRSMASRVRFDLVVLDEVRDLNVSLVSDTPADVMAECAQDGYGPSPIDVMFRELLAPRELKPLPALRIEVDSEGRHHISGHPLTVTEARKLMGLWPEALDS